MHRTLAVIALTLSMAAMLACSDSHVLIGLVQAKELKPDSAAALAAMPFDWGAPVTVRGTVSTLFFGPPGAGGMIVVHGNTGVYAFSTAGTRDMAKQGFTRFTMKPGQQVTVIGILAEGGAKIEGLTAARADTITTNSGQRLFDRAAL